MQRRSSVIAIAWVVVGVSACASAQAADPPKSATEPAPKSPAPAPPDVRTLEGTLIYAPLPPTRSVEAYMGVEYTLKTGDDVHVLGASDAVPAEALRAQDGKRVRVQCTMVEAAAPSPTESYPVGPDGAPLLRPARCRVQTLTAL